MTALVRVILTMDTVKEFTVQPPRGQVMLQFDSHASLRAFMQTDFVMRATYKTF